MIEEKEAIRAEAWVKEAVKEGAKVLIGGSARGGDAADGPGQRSRRDEGDVSGGVRPAGLDLRVRLLRGRGDDGGGLPYGLQAGVYTNDLKKAMHAVDRINVGGVMINDTSISAWTTCRTRNKLSGSAARASASPARR